MPPDAAAATGDEPLLYREVFGNVSTASQTVFYVLSAAAVACFIYGVYRRVRLWQVGVPSQRRLFAKGAWKRRFTDVLLQRRMITRPRASLAHRLLFSGFLVLFIGTVLIAIEHWLADLLGREPTNPVFHKGVYFGAYEVVLDLFGVAMLVGCLMFMRRRWLSEASIARAPSDWIVLWSFLAIGVTGYLLEAARIVLADTPLPGLSPIGYAGGVLLQRAGLTQGTAAGVHIGLWWGHALFALAFIAAFPYTRLLHSIAGAVTLSAEREKLGTLELVTLAELEATGRVGVGAIDHFDQSRLIQTDACVSCGRCEDACPAFEAGKPLSPRNVVQDVRRHLEQTAPKLASQPAGGDGASLHGDVITAETLWSCTACNACQYVCPLGVNPLGMITDMRRYLVGEGQLRGAPAASLQKTQRSGNPWGLPAGDRFAWAKGLDVPTVAENPNFEFLYWVGCAASYDRRLQRVARSVVRLLKAADVSFAVLGSEEKCTGESARRMGDEFLFQELAETNVATLNEHDVRKIVAHCPHCVNSFLNDYPQIGGRYEVLHHSELLARLVDQGRLQPAGSSAGGKMTYHDPCYLARVGGVTKAPRNALTAAVGSSIAELPRHGRQTSCCGGGGGRMWFDDAPNERSGTGRVAEILESGAETVAVGCPFCMVMLSDGVAAASERKVEVRDVAEIMADAIEA